MKKPRNFNPIKRQKLVKAITVVKNVKRAKYKESLASTIGNCHKDFARPLELS